ncbi:hypothetical protein DFJ73DRAFT_881133, partial [Zopfochytrium polystomum]
MAVFTRLSLVVIASSAICAGSLAGLALVESALVRTSSSSSMRRPPDSSSLFMLGAVFFTQWLGTTAYLPLIDWSEVGSRRVYERLGALGLSWVSYTALLSILVGSATHKTAILVVSPFLRVLGLATLQSLGNESSYGVNLGKLLKSCCFTVIDALVNTTSIWIVAFLVSFSDLSDTAQVSTVVTSLPIVVTMLAFEQLAYWHVAKSFQQSTVAEETDAFGNCVENPGRVHGERGDTRTRLGRYVDAHPLSAIHCSSSQDFACDACISVKTPYPVYHTIAVV